MKHKNAVATVVYKGVQPYFVPFLKSLEKQSDKNFQLVIFNNGLNDLESFLVNTPLKCKVINMFEKPTVTRYKLIQFLKDNNFKKVIFSDSDDELHKERVKLSLKELDTSDIIVNNFDTIDEKGNLIVSNYLSKRLKNKFVIKEDFIRDFNIMGLSNTAANISVFTDSYLPLNSSLKAYDWYLWTKVLQKKKNIVFLSNIKTFYRLHDNNFSSLRNTLSEKEIINGINVKIQHYNEFKNYSNIYHDLEKKLLIMRNLSKKSSWISDYKKKNSSHKYFISFLVGKD